MHPGPEDFVHPDLSLGDASDTAHRFLDTAPAGFLAVDADNHTVLYINTTLRRVVGSAHSAIVGTPVHDLFTPSSAASLSALVSTTSEAAFDTPTGATADLLTGSGTVVPVLMMANRSTERTGTVIRLTVQSAAAYRMREQRLARDRDIAVAAHSDVVDELTRTQDALDAAEHARRRAEAERARSQLLASTLQRSLLPPTVSGPPGVDVRTYYHHASDDEVGGDFYDAFPIGGTQWGFFLGDVSGKGAGAAAVTSLTRYTLRAAAVFDSDPTGVLNNLNTVLHHQFLGPDPHFCTVLYGTITPHDDGSATITLVSGGHPPALHLRGDGSADYIDTLGGQLVGALSNPHFRTAELTLAPGDVLLLYTDGLTEAHVGPGRARFDDTGALQDFAHTAAPTTAPQIIEDLTALLHSFGTGLQDDVALLAIGIPLAE